MSRIILPSPRVVAPSRTLVLPPGIKGRASIQLDATDDRITGTHGLASGSPAFTILTRCKKTTASVLAAGVTAGPNTSGRCVWVGGGTTHQPYAQLLGVTVLQWPSGNLADGAWHRLGLRHAGGTGPLQLLYDGAQRAASGAVTPALVAGDPAYIGTIAGLYPFGGWESDVRIYSRYLSDAEVAADFRNEAVDSTGLVRWWTCENPGYGTTCHEEIGNTNDAITGALWSPNVPLRRPRIVEDVPACPKLGGGLLTVASHADLRPGLSSFAWMGWIKWGGVATGIPTFLYQFTGGIISLSRHSTERWLFYLADAVPLGVACWGKATQSNIPWSHFAACCDRATGQAFLYVDAAAPGGKSLGALGSLDPTSVIIFFNGLAGDIRENDFVYRKGGVFSWSEIEAHYYDGVTPSNPGGGVVQIGWSMREPSGLVVASSPSGYNGTLSADSHTTKTRCPDARAAA